MSRHVDLAHKRARRLNRGIGAAAIVAALITIGPDIVEGADDLFNDPTISCSSELGAYQDIQSAHPDVDVVIDDAVARECPNVVTYIVELNGQNDDTTGPDPEEPPAPEESEAPTDGTS